MDTTHEDGNPKRGKHFMKGQPVGDANVFTPSIAKPLEKGEVSGLIHEFSAVHQNGINGNAASSSSVLLQQSWRPDGVTLKVISVGLALLAVIVAYAMEKLG